MDSRPVNMCSEQQSAAANTRRRRRRRTNKKSNKAVKPTFKIKPTKRRTWRRKRATRKSITTVEDIMLKILERLETEMAEVRETYQPNGDSGVENNIVYQPVKIREICPATDDDPEKQVLIEVNIPVVEESVEVAVVTSEEPADAWPGGDAVTPPAKAPRSRRRPWFSRVGKWIRRVGRSVFCCG